MREVLRPPGRGGGRTHGGQDTQRCLLRPPGACHSVPSPLKEGMLRPGLFRKAISRPRKEREEKEIRRVGHRRRRKGEKQRDRKNSGKADSF